MSGKIFVILASAAMIGIFGCERGTVEDGVTDEEPGVVENGEDGAGEIGAEDWDVDGDGVLDQEEFCSGLGDEGLFDQWDADNDGLLEVNEYSEGIFEIWDTDDDGYIEESEWDAQAQQWFEAQYSFEDWAGDDDLVSVSDFQTGVEENDPFSAYDVDQNGFNRDEFCEMVFAVTDANDNDRIEYSEWEPFYQGWF